MTAPARTAAEWIAAVRQAGLTLALLDRYSDHPVAIGVPKTGERPDWTKLPAGLDDIGLDRIADELHTERDRAEMLADLAEAPLPEVVQTLADLRDEQPTDLATLILDYEAARDAFNASPGEEDPESIRLQAAMNETFDAVQAAFVERGEDCTTLADAKAAARLAAREYNDLTDCVLPAALSLSALAYFLGPEVVS